MALTIKDVKKVAHLACISVTDAECQNLIKDLSNILDLVDKMNAVDTTGVTPMAHPMDTAITARPDQVSESNERELFQSIAPQVEAGLYLVPKVIEEDG